MIIFSLKKHQTTCLPRKVMFLLLMQIRLKRYLCKVSNSELHFPLFFSSFFIRNHILSVVSIIPIARATTIKDTTFIASTKPSEILSVLKIKFLSKSPKYVATNKKNTPSPLLISLSSLYLNYIKTSEVNDDRNHLKI